jgi:deazaflavin-dependent oxidoreductase (nitroreductase family)
MAAREDRNRRIIDEFRANDGRVGGPFEGRTLLLLHSVGARSGAPRTNPLAYLSDGDRYVVFASMGGAPRNPDWYHNLLAHPDVAIEVGTSTIAVRARVAHGGERDELWREQVRRFPAFGAYEAKAAPRTIPVIVLEPRPADPTPG